MPWNEFTALLVLATAVSFSPGPNTTLSSTLAANGGLRHALPFVLAVPVGWCTLLCLCAAGVGPLVAQQPALRGAIQAAGMAYLLWLAWQLARSTGLRAAGAAPLRVGFGHGVLLQFVNTKAWFLALTVIAGWVVGQPQPLLRLLTLLPVLATYALASNLLYACVGAALRQWLGQKQRLSWFNRAMAAALVLTAAWMLQAHAP